MATHTLGTPPIQGSAAEMAQTAVHCYFAAMLAMARAAAQICPHIGTPYMNGLVRLRKRLAFETTTHNLLDSLTAMETDLTAFARRVNEYYTTKSSDVAGLLEIVAKAVDGFENRDGRYLEDLGYIQRHTEEALAQAETAEERLKIYEYEHAQVTTLRQRLAANAKEVFEALREETRAYAERLQRAEAEASLDALTSLVHRRELERLIRDRIARGTVFSILLFDIHSMRNINERFGQEAGDQVLRQFGQRLVAQVRPRDIVARWGGDEFAIIFDCAAEDANARAQQIAQWVSGRYPVSVNGQDWKPELTAEVYLIEHHKGESDEAFASRVNAFKLVSAPSPVEIAIEPDAMLM